MLTEFKNVSQEKSAPGFRRWFFDDYFDLIVWYDEAREIRGFQLCYDISGLERAFTWKRSQPAMHTGVDSGEQSPLFNRSPLLVSDRDFSAEEVLEEFHSRAGQLEPEIVELISRTLGGLGAGAPQS